ncbi:MAG: hypothetical protein C0502_00670 [Opitutus sp.]|nr:hypothetical protein [Opitutus sp.]
MDGLVDAVLVALAVFGEPLVGGLAFAHGRGGVGGRHTHPCARSDCGFALPPRIGMVHPMKALRPLPVMFALLAVSSLFAADQALKIDREKSFVDVDVKATVGSFTGRLDKFQAAIGVDPANKIKSARFDFRFADLKTGEEKRDHHMMEWLGSADAAGLFELGVLALAPDGQGQANGKLTFHGVTERVEFPVNVTRAGRGYTIRGEVTVDYRTWGLKAIRRMGVLKVDPNVRVRFQMVAELPAPKED